MRMVNSRKDTQSQDETAILTRQLSWRRLLLLLLGIVLIAMSVFGEYLRISESPIRDTELFFLYLGMLVFVSGLVMETFQV